MSERAEAFRTMGIAFSIGAVGTGLVMSAIAFGGEGFTVLDVVLFSIAVGALVASFAALASVWDSRATLDRIFANDPGSRRVVTRAVTRGKRDTLTAEQQSTAARFAQAYHYLLPLQLTQSMLVIVAVGIIQVPNYVRNEGDALIRSLFVLIVVSFVVAVIMAVVQYRNVSRYAAQHPVDQTSEASPA